MEKIAFIIDGGFFTKRYKDIYRKHPTADDIESYVMKIFSQIKKSKEYPIEIYRIFYYDCSPLNNLEKVANKYSPMNEDDFDKLCRSFKKKCHDIRKFHNEMKIKDFFALRMGELIFHGWNQEKNRYWKPKLRQKGVDMKMGLDIASMTTKKLCTKLVLISGDRDMIPAMKMARKEGVQVYWNDMCTTRQGSALDLSTHSDMVIKLN